MSTSPPPNADRSAVELARAAARRGAASPRLPGPDASAAANQTAKVEPPTLVNENTFYEHLLSTEGLTALDELRDAGEALQSAVKLSDLKKRSTLAHLVREHADVDVAPLVKLQGSFAQSALVRSAPGLDVDVTAVASSEMLGARVRRAREERGLSQAKLAELADVGRRFVSELENGKSSLEFDKVLQVAAAAGITLLARERP